MFRQKYLKKRLIYKFFNAFVMKVFVKQIHLRNFENKKYERVREHIRFIKRLFRYNQ